MFQIIPSVEYCICLATRTFLKYNCWYVPPIITLNPLFATVKPLFNIVVPIPVHDETLVPVVVAIEFVPEPTANHLSNDDMYIDVYPSFVNTVLPNPFQLIPSTLKDNVLKFVKESESGDTPEFK